MNDQEQGEGDACGTRHQRPAGARTKTQRSGVGDFVREATPNFYDRFFGTAAALVREGIVRDEQLPGRPGRPKTQASYGPTGASRRGRRAQWSAPGAVTIFRRDADWFEVHVVVSKQEQDRRRAVPDEADLENRATAQAQIDALPRSAQEYREQRSLSLQSWLDTLWVIFETRNGGFWVGEQTMAAFDDVASQLVAIAKSAEVRYSQDMRAECVAKIASGLGVPREAIRDTAPPSRERTQLRLVSACK